MRPDVVSEALKADLNVYPMFPLLSAAIGSPFLCDVRHQPAHPPGLLPASSAPLTRTYRHMAFTSSPPMDLYIMDLFQFSHRRIEHGLSLCLQSAAGPRCLEKQMQKKTPMASSLERGL